MRDCPSQLGFAKWPVLWLLLVAQVVAAQTDSDAPAAATAVVERLQQALVEAMQAGETLDLAGRYQRLEPVIRETHDLDYIARFAARRFWSDLSAEQRGLYGDVFAELSISTYARQFSRHAGEHFVMLGAREYAGRMQLVQSELITGTGERIPFDYVLREDGGRWRIINIIVDGVSDLALKRAQYTAVFRREGFDGLIADLRKARDAP